MKRRAAWMFNWWKVCCNNREVFSRGRPIYRPIFGLYRYIGIGQNGRFYRPQ